MKSRINDNCLNKIKLISAYIVLAIVRIVDGWFLFARGAAYIDSDMASNFINAVVNIRDKTMLSRNWYYSTGYGIFGDVNMFELVMLFYKSNWVIARGIGVMTLLLILIIGFLFFSRMMGIEWSNAILFSAFVVSPLSYWVFLMLEFGGYYLGETIRGVFAIALCLCITRYSHKKKIFTVAALLMIFVAFISGFNGIKGIIFPYGPLILSGVLLVWNKERENQEPFSDITCVEWRYFGATLLSFLFCGFGYIISNYLVAPTLSFESKSNISWGPFELGAFAEAISECVSILGYQSDSHVDFLSQNRTVRSVFSFHGIANFFGIMLIIFMVFSTIRLLMRYKKNNVYNQIIILIMLATIFVGGVLFKLTDGYDTSAVYWVPVYPLMLMVMLVEIRDEDYKFKVTPMAITIVFTLCVAITSISTVKLYEDSPLYANPQLENVANWLVDHGYEKGFGTFWQSNAVTVLTNGRVEMWSVYGFDSLELNKWLQDKNHDERPKGDKIFALIGPNDELDRDVFLQYMNNEPGNPEVVYTDEEGYIVVEYK